MFCPQCGSRVREGSKFCSSCGTSLVLPTESGDHAEAQAPEANAEPEVKTGSLASFIRGRRRIGEVLVPNFVVLIACILAAAGVAFAAFMFYKSVIEPNLRQHVAQEQAIEEEEPAEPQEADQVEEPEATDEAEAQPAAEPQVEEPAPAPTYSYEKATAAVSVPIDPLASPGERNDTEYEYPVITTDGGNQEAIDKINAAIKSSIDQDVSHTSAVADTIEAYQTQNQGSDAYFSACRIRRVSVSYMDDSIVCLRDYRYETAFGAHGESTVCGVVFDLKTGDTVDALTLFGLSGEQLKAKVITAVAIYADNHLKPSDTLPVDYDSMRERCLTAPKSYGDVKWVIPGSTYYYVSDEGLVFPTADYELGSYADGRADVVVAGWSDNSLVGTAISWDDFGSGKRR